MAKAESALQLLVARASSMFPPGEARSAYKNMEARSTLIRALPPYSSLKANDLYQNFTTRLGRACHMDELFRGLDQCRSSIDRDIKANGADINTFKSTNNNKRPRYTNYSVDSIETKAGSNSMSGHTVRPCSPSTIQGQRQL